MAKKAAAAATQERPWEGLPVPEEMQAQPTYPVIQWINHGHRLAPPQERGGFFSAHRFGVIELPNGIKAKYHQDDGTFSQTIKVAILALRQGWFVKQGDTSVRVKTYRDKARKKVQALVLLRAEDGSIIGPAKMTVTGLANDAIPEAFFQLNATATQNGAQPWMFWTTMQAGEAQEVGDHGQQMTPIEVAVPSAEELEGAFIGAEAVGMVNDLAPHIDQWRNAWNGGSQVEPEATAEAEDDDGEAGRAVVAGTVKVTTKKHGSITFGDLREKDAEYFGKVVEYIVGHPGDYKANVVQAARLLQAHPDAEAGKEEDEIPF
jgi:hypothetical protein